MQHEEDLLRCLKAAKAQGYNKAKSLQLYSMCHCLTKQTMNIPGSKTESSSSRRCAASQQEKVRPSGEEANKSKTNTA